jgi:hypothetical protein
MVSSSEQRLFAQMAHFSFYRQIFAASGIAPFVRGGERFALSTSRPAQQRTRISTDIGFECQGHTRGQKIPSLYVKVFSDGTAECHAIKFTGRENNDVKREHLPAKEFAEIKSLLDQPEMQGVKGRYEHPRAVADSWMEWELRAPDSRLRQEVTISFGPPTQELRAFPEALGSLGCQILKIREYVYGDRAEYYSPACVAAVDHPQK